MIVKSGGAGESGGAIAPASLRSRVSFSLGLDFARSLLSESLEQRIQCSCLLLLEY